MDFEKIKFDEKGLVPAVVQDYFTKEVLTVAYMNRESLEITVKEGYTCFYSRSRQELWRKGETSGNKQKVVSIVSDCDNDALVIEVIKNGPACHTGAESCFHNTGQKVFWFLFKTVDFTFRVITSSIKITKCCKFQTFEIIIPCHKTFNFKLCKTVIIDWILRMIFINRKILWFAKSCS